jgi:hypothetical protein
MIETRQGRIRAIVLLLVCQTGLFPLFGVQPINPYVWVLPSEEEFVNAPKRYLGEHVETQGIVRETTPIVIRTRTTSGTY